MGLIYVTDTCNFADNLLEVAQKEYREQEVGFICTQSIRSCTAEKNQRKLLQAFTVIFIPPTRSLCQILPRGDPWSKCNAMLIQRHVPCYITHCSPHIRHECPHFYFFIFVSLWRVYYRPQPLAAGYTKNGEWVWGGRAQLKPRSRSGLARPGPAWPSPVQPTTTSAVSLEPPRLLSSIANRGGNVSLGVDQETSMPKQGASCPDTALPVGYVRTFLPFTLSPYMCLSPTPLAGCPSASCLRAMVCFFSLVCALWRCGSLCECLCGRILPLFNSSPTKIIHVATNLSHVWPYADVWRTEDPRRSRTVDRAINLILLFSDICFTSQ